MPDDVPLREENKKLIIPKVEHLLDVYYDLPNAQAKNDLLRTVLEKVVYYREKRAVRGSNLEEFELQLFPKLP